MNISKDNWLLVWSASNEPVDIHNVVRCFRGDFFRVIGGTPPKNASSSGIVTVVDYDNVNDSDRYSFYPSAFDMKWIEV
jgi:hypothetical protein